MDYSETEEMKMIRETARKIVDDYDRDYVSEHVEEKKFPEEFWDDLAESGFVGTMIDEEYGGADMGMLEMSVILEELAREGSPGGLLLVLTAIFGGVGIQKHGTEEQKDEYLPRIASGDMLWSLGVTEPNAGINTLQIETTAEKDGDEYVINGSKTWNSGTNKADMMLLTTRTTEYDPDNPTHGITLFLVPNPADQDGISLNQLESVAPWFEKQYTVHFDDVRVSEDQILGDVDGGLYQLWDTLNTERIATAASGVGCGLRAVDLGVEYANDRKVFGGQPISSHQAIQQPLAESYAKVMSAREMGYKASWKWDNNMECGLEANTAKLLASEAAEEAASNAIQAHGGNAFNQDYDVFSLWVNSRIIQVAPIPNEMVKNFIGEHQLGMPKSY